MKRMALLAILVCIGLAGQGWSETVGDINNDGKVGLPEAVYALEVSSGIQPAAVIEPQVFDMAEYSKLQPGWRYLYRQKQYNNGIVYESVRVMSASAETFQGKNVITEIEEAGRWVGEKLYYEIGDTDVKRLGGAYGGETYWLSPPIVMGTRAQKINELIVNAYEYKYPDHTSFDYRDYRIVGIEDVVTPAGEFKNCLKIVQKRVQGTTYIDYKAKDIGTIKSIQIISGGRGYMDELLNVFKSDGSQISEIPVCAIQGAFTNNGNPEEVFDFSTGYIPNLTPIYMSVEAPGTSYSSITINLTSNDGIHFLPDPDVYPDNPHQISITIDGNTVSGTYSYLSYSNTEVYNIAGTVTCYGN